MIPFPVGVFSGGRAIPILNQISAGTTVVAAWSTGRLLKSGVLYSVAASIIGTSVQKIGFYGGVFNSAALISYAAGGATAVQGTGGTGNYLFDQTGNANHLARGNANSYFCPLTTGAGALNAPFTCLGKSVPGWSTGYNGLSTGNNGPFLSTVSSGGALQSPMNVSFGATNKWWFSGVVRSKSGSGSVFGRIGSFVHTGDSRDFNSPTSAVLNALNNSNTNGFQGGNNNGASTNGEGPVGTPYHFIVVWDGVHQTLYINGVNVSQVANTASLGAGGTLGVGDDANAGAFGLDSYAGDYVELMCGTTLASADLTLITANMMAAYSI